MILTSTPRLDGLMSLDTPLHSEKDPGGSIVLTKPLRATGGEFVINVDTGAQGAVWVEVLQPGRGTVVPGFGFEHSVATVTNDVNHAVRWVDAGVLYGAERLGEQLVQLRIRMVGTKLFSFGFDS